MIGSLRGTLVDRDPAGEVLIEVAGTGLGYRAVMGPAAAMQLGEVGDEVFLWTYHHIREDNQCLYGFSERAERHTFESLLAAHGGGPARAVANLSVHGPEELARVVAEDDTAALCLVPGVGKKTAARLLIELQSRLDTDGLVPATSPDGVAGSESGGLLGDVHAALEGLGYRSEEITTVLRNSDVREAADTSEAIRLALRALGPAR